MTGPTSAGNCERFAGILLHPTSLPGRYGIGDLGDELTAFLDWAASAGMKIWQVLPLNPTGFGNSPYGCLSSFAGNPLLISPQRLLHEGLLPYHVIENVPSFPDDHVDFDAVAAFKDNLLRVSFAHFEATAHDDLRRALADFVAADAQQGWLDDWTLFMALKQRLGDAKWSGWEPSLARRAPEAMALARNELADEIRFQQYVQWLFFRQWRAVRDAARSRGILIMGDVPIYVAEDSADVWAARELFQLDENGAPAIVAGVPPDYFSATGQRWGNPLYRWDLMREDGYRWWIERIRANLRLADVIRLDHFRGFSAYWEIPATEPTAIHGRWVPGPGLELFKAIGTALGGIPLVAEDLGFITQEVHDLRRTIGVPGMKILQFGFSEIDSPHLPHRYDPATVAYTGTHDNDTARGWFASAPAPERYYAQTYFGSDGTAIEWPMIRAVYTSVAQTAIVPVQDILGLGSEARMNRPGNSKDNWSWRYPAGALTSGAAETLRSLAEVSGRL
ncbi:MAG TPA: 4-alpha-glucanotransferase [Thermoanaerobaculia bacterium]|nr:4-alpha-glucanotransferase [Thermoanaerobaculia bacterium]